MGSLLHGFLSGSIRFLSVAPKKLYHKIDLSPNPVFQRWRAFLKSWSVFPSLSLLDRERTAHCRKKLHDNKTLKKPFFSLYIKRLRVNVRIQPTSVLMYAYKACSHEQAKSRGINPLIIYTHTKHNLNICSCLLFYFSI